MERMEQVKRYRSVRSTKLNELGAWGTELVHEKSGAKICCIENPEDSNKVFAITFRTPPQDDTGVAHILEHSVLCGSEKFPLKDPFVELAKGSVNTFLNAMTFEDKTMYPVASQNERDLYHLMDVYMDAVFHPNILRDPRIMMQEGWHYELTEPEAPVTIKGVVYNEMKGAFSSSDTVLRREINRALFGDTPYGYESGGAPEAIPQLTQEKFLAFYKKYYHPSNSFILLYGDMKMEEYLEWLDTHYLGEMTAKEGYGPELLPEQPAFTEPHRVEAPYSVSEAQGETDGYLSYSVAIKPEEPTESVDPNPEPETPAEAKLPILRVEGRYLKNEKGEIVNLHGFTQTYSPFFNNNAWGNYDVQACLRYNKSMVDGIVTAGWKFNFVRMHLDPYWSDGPSMQSVRYEGHERFSETRFRKYLEELFVPMAEYFISKGMYVVMRPPGVCPSDAPYQGIEIGDTYQQFLLKVWDIVSQHPKLKNNMDVMFELANEPVRIKGTDGTYGSSGDGHFKNLQLYFQAIVDKIRTNCHNIVWVPGLSYQSSYAGYAIHRIEGENIGFAVHCYPGWYGSDAEEDSGEGIGSSTGGGYEAFQRGWDAQVGPVAVFAPIMVTEIDWAPKKYDATWGKSITGTAGAEGFGANFKYIADNSGNVSWLFFTTRSHELVAFKDVPGEPGNYTFLNDPEACPWAMYHWFKEYADGIVVNGELEKLELMGQEGNLRLQMGGTNYLKVKAVYSDGTVRMVTAEATVNSSDTNVLKVEQAAKLVAVAPGEATVTVTYQSAAGVSKQLTLQVTVISPFSLTADVFNPSIWEKGTFDENTRTLVTGQYGFGGWQYDSGLDLSGYKTVTVELGNDNESGVSFRLFDKTSYWSEPATYDFGSSRKIVVELNNMKDKSGRKIDPSHLYIAGFWSTGGKPIVIANVFLAN